MIRRLTIFCILSLAVMTFAPHLYAQDIALSSISTVQGGLVLNECSFDMENGFDEFYIGASATCTQFLQGNQQNQFVCGTNGYGDTASDDCQNTASPLPGDTYEIKAAFTVWFDFDDDLDEYDDPFGYLQLSGPIVCADSCTVGDISDEDFSDDFDGAVIATTVDSYTTVSIAPTQATIAPGKTVQFSSDDTVNWTLKPNTGSFNMSTLVYTAPTSVSSQESVTIEACNVDNSTDCASADVTIEPVSVSVSPESADVVPGTTQQFTAVVTPSTLSQTVTWSTSSTTNGSINTSSGLYTALPPAQVTTSSSFQVIATSQADGTTTGMATATVAPVTVTVTGTSPFLATAGTTQTLTASVSGTTNNAVTWTLASGSVGSVSQAGIYTAPAPAIQATQSATVNACLTANLNICGTFTIALVPPVVITSVVPASWPAGQVVPVSFNGSGFGTNPTITLSDASLTFVPTSPQGTPPSGTVTIPTLTGSETVTVTVKSTSNAINSQASGTATVVGVTLTVAVSPTSVQLEETATQQFTPTVTCKTGGGVTCTIPQTVKWTLSPNLGTFNSSNLYTASSSVSSQTVVTAKACSTVNPLVCATSAITLIPINVTVTPPSASLTSGETQQFTSQLTGAVSSGVTWTISPSVGTISASGLYTAPNPVTAAQSVTITAASKVDTTRKGTATASLTVTPGFTLSATPTSQSVAPSASTTYTVSASSLGGFTGSVALSASGLPTGATAAFSPTSVTGSGSSTLTVATSVSTPPGTYTLTIKGTSGTLTQTKSVTIVVTVPGFSLSQPFGTGLLQVAIGQVQTVTVTATPSPGFTGNVALTIGVLPSGVTAGFSPASIAGGSGTSTLTLTVSPSLSVGGNYTFTITGTSGSVTSSVNLSITIPTPTVSVSFFPPSQTLKPGSSTTASLTVVPLNDMGQTWTLTLTGLPAGVTGSLSPTSIGATGGTSTLTLTASASAAPGTSMPKVTATANIVQSTNLTLALSTCTYTLSPTSAAISTAGGSGTVSVTTQAGCSWSAVSSISYVTVTSGNTGTGNGSFAYTVTGLPARDTSRSGIVTVWGQEFTETQSNTFR